MSQEKRLFLLDAYALIFRAYYAFIKNPRFNSKGLNTSAVLGFTNTLIDIIKRENPTHIAVVFDVGGKTIRHEEFEQYKANRDETPEGIKVAVPYIKKIIEAFEIPVLFAEGYEADDVIGTLAKKAEKEGFTTYMMTPDKDFAQLVSENIKMYKPARMGNGIEIWGVEEVKAKFEIDDPLQVIDYLGMMGDSVDNIPGLPGVGDKTAKKFLKQYGSLENLLENTHELKGKMKEKVEANKELGLLSKKLATILLDAPVEFDEKSLIREMPNFEDLNALFDELEFRRIKETVARLFGQEKKEAPKAAQPKVVQGDLFAAFAAPNEEVQEENKTSMEDTNHLYQLIDNEPSRQMLLKYLLKQKEVCFDTETTSLNAMEAELVGIAFSFTTQNGFYVPFPANPKEAEELIEEFRPFFENDQILKIGHNLKYDIQVLANYNLEVKGPLFDTMVAHYLLEPDMRHNMDVLCETYLNYSPQSITELIGKKGKNQGNMRDVDVELVKEYAAEDADMTLRLKQLFAPKLEETGVLPLFENMEMPLVTVLQKMEREGINLDIQTLKEQSEEISAEVAILEKKIYEDCGEEFNLNSPKQLGVVLFENMKIVDKPKKTKTGQYATGEEILSKLAKEHPIVEQILEYRQLQKLLSTYIDALPKEILPKTGRIHTQFGQTVASTGRLSSNNPNLQNIPIRTPRGQKVRAAFVPKDNNHTLLAADYSQIELRIIAEMCKDEAMVTAFKEGLDIHAATAAKLFKVPLDEVSREQRSYAKTVNFGIIYGVSAFGLSEQTDLSRKEAKEMIENYFLTYPKLKEFMDEMVNKAREEGYVETIKGRKRYLRDINSANAVVRGHAERNAVNAPVQGSAADVIKIAMIDIQKELENGDYATKMLLQVHDELLFDVPNEELEKVQSMIKEKMETAIQTEVPLLVEIGRGDNWLKAH